MNRVDLVDALVDMDYRKGQAGMVINDIFMIISEALVRKEKVSIRGFGTFEVKRRKGHLIQDACTKEKKMTKDFDVVTFRAGDNLKAALETGDPKKLSILSKSWQDDEGQ